MRLVVSLLAALLALAPLPVSAIASAAEAEGGEPCEGSTTPAVNECYAKKLEAAEASMARYLQAAINRYHEQGDHGIALGLADSQKAFEAYRDIECGAVHYRWRDGTIRVVMELTCRIALTDQRTHALWASWLTYPDSPPPTLPEPVPAE
jgi:uncharacterized protein YecT (DUF1311 family)